MPTEQTRGAELPASIRSDVESLCEQLHEVLGDLLVSVVLYGPSAKSVTTRESVPINLMIVLRDVSTKVLDRISSFVREGTREHRLSVMILTELDIERSTDVFPVKFLDMQHSHIVLHGETVLDNLLIGGDNLRLRCEQETRNTLLRLRNLYLQRSTQPEQLQATLLSALSSLLTTLNAFLFLTDGRLRQSESEIASAARDRLRLESDVLQKLIEIRQSQQKADVDTLKSLYDAFMATVQRSAEVIDRFTPRDQNENE